MEESKEESKESYRSLKTQEQATLLKAIFPTIQEEVILQVINKSNHELNNAIDTLLKHAKIPKTDTKAQSLTAKLCSFFKCRKEAMVRMPIDIKSNEIYSFTYNKMRNTENTEPH